MWQEGCVVYTGMEGVHALLWDTEETLIYQRGRDPWVGAVAVSLGTAFLGFRNPAGVIQLLETVSTAR